MKSRWAKLWGLLARSPDGTRADLVAAIIGEHRAPTIEAERPQPKAGLRTGKHSRLTVIAHHDLFDPVLLVAVGIAGPDPYPVGSGLRRITPRTGKRPVPHRHLMTGCLREAKEAGVRAFSFVLDDVGGDTGGGGGHVELDAGGLAPIGVDGARRHGEVGDHVVLSLMISRVAGTAGAAALSPSFERADHLATNLPTFRHVSLQRVGLFGGDGSGLLQPGDTLEVLGCGQTTVVALRSPVQQHAGGSSATRLGDVGQFVCVQAVAIDRPRPMLASAEDDMRTESKRASSQDISGMTGGSGRVHLHP